MLSKVQECDPVVYLYLFVKEEEKCISNRLNHRRTACKQLKSYAINKIILM